MSLLDEIPGYREAILEERGERELAFVGVPEQVGPWLVRPLSMRDIIILTHDGNALVCGGDPSSDDVARFFVHQSHRKVGINRMTLRLLVRNWRDIACDIQDWIDQSMQDSPAGNGVENGAEPYSWVASILTTLGSECGQPADKVMVMPMKAIWQLVRCIQHQANPKKTFFNPSDKVRTRYLDTLNKDRN